MKCQYCNTDVADTAILCDYCGFPVRKFDKAEISKLNGGVLYRTPQPMTPNYPVETDVYQGYASATLAFGILSIFSGIVSIILTFVFNSKYQHGYGYKDSRFIKKAKAGRICACVSIGLRVINTIIAVISATSIINQLKPYLDTITPVS